jgi:repressor LexA
MIPHRMTAKKTAALEYINTYIQEHGYPPTVREIARATGHRSTSSAAFMLTSLEKLGKLRRTAGIPRGLAPVEDQQERCPCCGRPTYP